MVDFNTKKNILKKLRKVRSENKLLWLPCVIAAAFVKLWYGTVCRIGMALSDRNGNFLGMKMPERQRKARRKDDIVYVKRPFLGRVMSAVLAAAFIAMFVPELGISFDVSAAAGPIKLEYDGKEYSFWRDATPGSNLVIYDGIYQAAAYYDGVTIHDPVKAYGHIKLSWEIAEADYTDYNDLKVELTQYVSGYKIVINDQSGKNLYDQTINNTNTSIRDYEVKLDYTSDMNVRIYPIFRVPAWIYLEGVPDPDKGTSDTLTPPSSNTTFAPVESTRSVVKQLGKADAHFDAASMNVILTDTAGMSTEEFYPDSSSDVNIVWDQPQMICDGVAVGEYPDGYWVYLYDYTSNRMAAKKQEIAPSAQGSPKISRSVRTLFQNDLSYGHHYRIFVEAYKNVWGGPPASYSVTNTGLVTSSLYAVSLGDAEIYKLYQNYPDNNINLCKDLFVAPYIEFDKIDYTKSSISVSWKKNTGSTYNGVEIYRSTEDIQSSDLVNVLVTNAGKPNNEYGVEKIGEYLEDRTLSHTDYNINKDTRYYYYIVPFITKTRNDTNRIRGTAARNGGTLEFNLTTVRITYTTDNGEVKLKWTPSRTANNSYGNADGYKLEIFQKKRYNPDTKLFDTIPNGSQPVFTDDTFGPNDLSYDHNGLFNNEVYTYVVTPYVNVNPQSGPPKPFYGPSTSIDVTVGGLLGVPENVTAECTADGEVTIKWDRVPNATGYTITYTDEYNGEIVTGTLDSKTNTKVHKGLLLDHVITYEVNAYKTVTVQYESQTTYGEKSVPVKVKVGSTLARPQNLKTTTTDGTVNITWSPVSGAKGYLLQYKFTKKDGTSVEFVNDIAQIKDYVFDLTDAKYTHLGLRNGDRYTYRVLAYKDVSGETVYSPWSDESWVIVGVPLDAPKDFSGTTKDGLVNLKWTAVKGAEGYILRFRKNGGAWEEVDVSKTSFQHVGLNNGDRYEYYVKAYKTVNGERIFSDEAMSNHLIFTVGDELGAPKDFNATVTDGQVTLTWTAVKGAEGYIVHAYSGGSSYQFNVSRPTYIHTGLVNGDSWTYYVTAYKTVNGERTYSTPSESKTVTVGIALNSAVDLTATAGNRQIDLKWTAVKGAEGYVVYLYNSTTMEFEPITDTSKTNYSHVGLKNGKQYTYMVAPYKTINGKRFYGNYSMSVTAIPTTGSITDMDHELKVKGTAPYGISHSEYIKAVSNHGAFDESVDIYFSTNRESTEAVRNVLKNYADGLSSFIIYPFDISIYRENTYIKVDPEDGYTVTVTMPVPDRLIAYRDYITVVHIADVADDREQITMAEDWYNGYDQRLEILPCAIVDIDNVWCVQFKCSSFSPYALVIYKDHIQDVASGGGLLDDGFADTFNSGLLLFTALPDIMPNNRKLKIVQSGSKRYHIKSVTKK
ncbi:MAG: fibronectin type III domain-containing protein [Oscillospiraceae bacterium]|nr:fibronectin type III domain-containing protein [Oscillospiraceae bacterium]